MISINDLSLSFGGFTLLDNINFHISDGDRIGLVGKNGAGKSTILKLILGIESPSSGKILKPVDLKIGYLPQQMAHNKDKSVIDETMTAFADILALNDKLDAISQELAERTDYESDTYQKLIVEMNDITDRLSYLSGESPQMLAEKTLVGLGFKREEFNRATSTFSQGWNMRIELAKVLLRRPDILLLDEPTNHLDLESITALNNGMSEFQGTVLFTSHDHELVNTVANRVIEITPNGIIDKMMPYDDYLKDEKMIQMKTELYA